MGEGVDTGAMTITPGNANAVGSDEGHPHRTDRFGHRRGIKQGSPRHFLDTLRTGTRQAEKARGVVGTMLCLALPRPLHSDSILFPDDSGGHDPVPRVFLHRILPLAT